MKETLVKGAMLLQGRLGGIDWISYGVEVDNVLEEIERAVGMFPWWPEDPIHAAGIVQEEAGELGQAAQNYVYHDGDVEDMRREAIQTAAMAIRFLRHFDRMTSCRSDMIQEGFVRGERMKSTEETVFFRRSPQTRRIAELLENPHLRRLGSTSEQCAVHLALGQAHLAPKPYNTETEAWGRLDDDQRDFVNLVRLENGMEAL